MTVDSQVLQENDVVSGMKDNQFEAFFIVGCGRSGTTLLKSIISAHPDIYVMPETFFFRSILPKVKLSPKAPWNALDKWWIADAGITPDNMRPLVLERLEKGQEPGVAVLSAVFDFYRTKEKSPLIGEKTPDHINYINFIREWYPGAPIIQIIRDPRAVLASYRHVNVGPNTIAGVVKEWSTAFATMERWHESENYLVLKYEDLINDPEKVLKEVCALLEVRWSAQMLEFHNRDTLGFALEQKHHANTLKPLFKNSLHAWKSELSESDVSLVEWALSEPMSRYGYELNGNLARFPRLNLALSSLITKLHHVFVLFPRQKLKAIVARHRQGRR